MYVTLGGDTEEPETQPDPEGPGVGEEAQEIITRMRNNSAENVQLAELLLGVSR